MALDKSTLTKDLTKGLQSIKVENDDKAEDIQGKIAAAIAAGVDKYVRGITVEVSVTIENKVYDGIVTIK